MQLENKINVARKEEYFSKQNILARERRFQQFIFYRNFSMLKKMILIMVFFEITIDTLIS